MSRTLLLSVWLVTASCAHLQENTKRAIAVSVGALGTGAATAAQNCIADIGPCQKTALLTLIVVAGIAVSSGAYVWLTPALSAPASNELKSP